MTNTCPHNTPDEIYKIIEDTHDWRTVHVRLSLVLKIIEEDKAILTRKVSFEMYAIYDEWEAIAQSSQIPNGVFVETCTYTIVWETDKDYGKMTEPKDSDFDDFDCDTFFAWDSPDLPTKVTENACARLNVDEVQVGEDLIEHYGSLEKVDFADFPTLLKPLLEVSIIKYNHYNKFNGYPKVVT